MEKHIKKALLITMLLVVISGCGQQVNNNVNSSPKNTNEIGDVIIPTLSSTPTSLPTSTSISRDTAMPTEEAADVKEYKTYTWEEIDKMVNSRNDITDPLKQEYIYWMHELEKEYTPRNLVMAVGYRNISQGYFGAIEGESEDTGNIDWNKETPNARSYMKEHPFIPIIFEMTGDFIRLTAVVQPIGYEYQEFYDLMNDTRNSCDEVEFLKGLNDLGYYAVDVYVEDLLELNRRIPCNGIKLYEKYATNLKEIYDNITNMPEDNELQAYLKRYDRQVNFSNELKNKEWNLFLFNKQDVQPAIIEMHIRSYDWVGGIGLREKI